MEENWFLHYEGIVHGPFPTSVVNETVQSRNFTPDTLVWKKGMSDWAPLSHWEKLQNLPIISSQEIGQSQTIWQIDCDGKITENLNDSAVIRELKKMNQIIGVRIFSSYTNEWKPLTECKDLLSSLGYPVRQYPRVPIVGSANVQKENQQSLELDEVSEGGFGVRNGFALRPKEIVSVTLRSVLISNPLHLSAKVLYVKDSGFAGFSFEQISNEAKSLLIDYIKTYQSGKHNVTLGEEEKTPVTEYFHEEEVTKPLILFAPESPSTPAEPVDPESETEVTVSTIQPAPLSSAAWFINHYGKKIGPLSKTQLLEQLQLVDNASLMNVWTSGFSAWTTVLSCPELMNELKLPKRQYARAPIVGEATILGLGKNDIYSINSISKAGIGFLGGHMLPTGAKLQLIVRSPVLPRPFGVEVTVSRISETGEVAARFLNLNNHAEKMVQDYIENYLKIPTVDSAGTQAA